MYKATSPQAGTCTVQRKNGEFCDTPSADDMPFPICGRHASRLFARMNELLSEFDSDPLRRLMAGLDDMDSRRERADKRAAKRGPGVIYYVLVGNLLKIGYSQSLQARLRTYPPSRKLLATEPGTFALESQRHAQFAHLLDSGREWFRFEGDLVEHVKTIRDHVAA
ncbi:MAG: hypothetical protein JWP74_1747 [Marmoricola sp.]|nr:hypothetical protein [Marmoricola sp.]